MIEKEQFYVNCKLDIFVFKCYTYLYIGTLAVDLLFTQFSFFHILLHIILVYFHIDFSYLCRLLVIKEYFPFYIVFCFFIVSVIHSFQLFTCNFGLFTHCSHVLIHSSELFRHSSDFIYIYFASICIYCSQ